ncbi:MAG TPA: GNAT family N-acetyltransferase [Chitinophaga sp.]|uniref:GNAT family N-acetyltransferase n=1 Tax=Chitinophaga sp. TaxID=1869181 RepID=UPI002C1AEC7C|nr:GNAT family N-acetyltransferase [Chitinophaga sp.]HVI47740.1 GNAT family N-acetyltransferase [Chitinophaga sp.]
MELIAIRKAVLADLDTLLEFEQGIVAAERPFNVTMKDGSIHYYDIEAMINSPEVEVLVATVNGEAVGSGYARIENAKPYLKHGKHAYLGFMYVKPEHRGKGINQRIIAALKAWAYLQDVKELRLDVYDENTSAVNAYEKAGFERHLLHMRMNVDDDLTLHV